MGKLSITEKIIRAAMSGERLPLEGRTRITLTDARTGKKEIHEHKNDVTNAVSYILNSNYSGESDLFSLLPLRQFFSGVMCFGSAFNDLPTRVPNQNVNALIAHAGDEAPTQQSSSTRRGVPNFLEQVETDISLKQVWDFSTNQGNGTINSVCLVPNVLGNYGTMPVINEPKFILSGGSKTMVMASADVNMRARKIRNPIEITAANECISVYISGTTFEEITSVHDYTAFGFLRSGTQWVESSTRSATIRSFTSGRALLAFDDDYYYVYEPTSATTIKMDKIDRSDMSVTTNDLTLTGASLYSGNQANDDGFVKFPFDGTYLYLPDSTAKKFYKINIGNQSDFTLLSGELTKINITSGQTDYDGRMQPIVVSPGLILGDNYVINYDTVYGIAYSESLNGTPRNYGYGEDTHISFAEPKSVSGVNFPSVCMSGYSNGNYNRQIGQGLVIPRMFLSTVNDLSEAVTKGSNQNMKIEYTLTEV